MAIQYRARKLISGLSTDTKPSASNIQAGSLFFETDTMDMYENISSVWTLQRTFAQTFQNKTIDIEKNTMYSIHPFTFSAQTQRRVGAFNGAPTALGGLSGAMGDMAIIGDAGAGAVAVDNTEGAVNSFTGSNAAMGMGIGCDSTHQLITRRAHNPSLTARCKMDIADATTRIYVGFSSAQPLPISNSVLASGDSGVIVGWNPNTANYSVFSNDGTGTMVTTTMGSGIAKNTSYHTFAITMSASNVVCTLDGGNTVTLTTRIPATTTDLYTYLHGQMV